MSPLFNFIMVVYPTNDTISKWSPYLFFFFFHGFYQGCPNKDSLFLFHPPKTKTINIDNGLIWIRFLFATLPYSCYSHQFNLVFMLSLLFHNYMMKQNGFSLNLFIELLFLIYYSFMCLFCTLLFFIFASV